MACAAAHKEPSKASCARLDDVDGVESVKEGAGRAFVVEGRVGGVRDVVETVGEGEEVHRGEDGHLDAEECGGDADFDVRVCDLGCGFEGTV